jgi:DNA-binding response OmpR family regulator
MLTFQSSQRAPLMASDPKVEMTAAKILLIDDDSRLTAMVGDYLRGHGYDVETAGSLAEGRSRLQVGAYDALVLDLMLPDGDGLDLTRELRNDARLKRLPLLMLTARGEPMDRIVGLELGADDYLPKPFEPRELLARIKALLRRATPEPEVEDVLEFGRLEVDLGAREARLDGKRCELTSHQFDLLAVLAQSPGRVLSRDQIMDALKGHPLEAFDRSIDVHVSRIRAVIEDDPKNPKRVLTVRERATCSRGARTRIEIPLHPDLADRHCGAGAVRAGVGMAAGTAPVPGAGAGRCPAVRAPGQLGAADPGSLPPSTASLAASPPRWRTGRTACTRPWPCWMPRGSASPRHGATWTSRPRAMGGR